MILEKLKLYFINTIGSWLMPHKLRNLLYRLCTINVDSKAFIKSGCYFQSTNIEIGKSYINGFCKFYTVEKQYVNNAIGGGKIIIEDDCTLAFGVTLCCVTHEIGPMKHRAGKPLA